MKSSSLRPFGRTVNGAQRNLIAASRGFAQ